MAGGDPDRAARVSRGRRRGHRAGLGRLPGRRLHRDLADVRGLDQPGERGNRRQIAIAQAFMACLLVHFSRGRYESQVAAVASFIFVALYRDARTLLLATGILAVDYVLGTFFWSEALYGHRTVSSWAWVRHLARLSVEDVSLIVAIYKSKQDLKRTAQRTAGIERHQAVLEREVAERQRT